MRVLAQLGCVRCRRSRRVFAVQNGAYVEMTTCWAGRARPGPLCAQRQTRQAANLLTNARPCDLPVTREELGVEGVLFRLLRFAF
jgi:hypothetical protein